MFNLVFFVPESHLELVKTALFDAGAGRAGHYDSCCWQTLGQGQFRALTSSKPFVGELDQLTQLAEYRVEMICADDCLAAVVARLRDLHPYEEPAFIVTKMIEV